MKPKAAFLLAIILWCFNTSYAQTNMVVTSGNKPTLYKGCLNTIYIHVPEMEIDKSINFKVIGAHIYEDNGNGLLKIIPHKPQVKIYTYKGLVKIDSSSLKVRLLAKPDIRLVDHDGKEINQRRGYSYLGLPSKLKFITQISDYCYNAVPKDARYKVKSFNIMLIRGKRPIKNVDVKGNEINIEKWRQIIKPGDRILLNVKELVRTNYLNKEIKLCSGLIIVNISITD